jgi:hypothetical protein
VQRGVKCACDLSPVKKMLNPHPSTIKDYNKKKEQEKEREAG